MTRDEFLRHAFMADGALAVLLDYPGGGREFLASHDVLRAGTVTTPVMDRPVNIGDYRRPGTGLLPLFADVSYSLVTFDWRGEVLEGMAVFRQRRT